MPELVKMMKQTNTVLATRALMVVDRAGKAGIPVLLDVLTNRQAYVGVLYLEGAMGQLGTDGQFAVPALVSCLTNKNWGVAVIAARWLGRIRMEPEIVVPALASCLDAPDARVRSAAIQALGEYRMRAQWAIPSLVRELSDPDNEIRAVARNSLDSIEPDFLGQAGEHGQSF
jgi:HEAT repeat protein